MENFALLFFFWPITHQMSKINHAIHDTLNDCAFQTKNCTYLIIITLNLLLSWEFFWGQTTHPAKSLKIISGRVPFYHKEHENYTMLNKNTLHSIIFCIIASWKNNDKTLITNPLACPRHSYVNVENGVKC